MAESIFITSRLRVGLGTFVAIEVHAGSVALGEAAVGAAFAAVGRVDTLLHPRRQGSDLAALNQSAPGSILTVHPWTWAILDLCKRLNRLSRGTFDPCIGESGGALADLELGPRSAERCHVIAHARLSIDLGGIGKGFAVDRAIDALRAAGCGGGLVNAGGDLAVFGERAHEVLCQDPHGRMATLTLRDAALATSDADDVSRPSEHRGYYSGNDPHWLASGRAAVTAPSAAIADGLTKCMLIDASNSALLLALGAPKDRLVKQQNITRIFGPRGRPVAAVGQGSWRSDETDAAQALNALRRGLDLGLTHIDTAEMYGSGAAERIVGEAIEGRRDQVFLVSKVLPSNASKHGTLLACEKSLARLKTDRLDCYLLHWRGSYPLEETVAAFDLLVRDGKILSWGVSNFDVDDLEEVCRIAGPGHPTCNQVLYHLRERAIEHRVVPWCSARGIAVVAYTPFGETPAVYAPGNPQGKVLQDIAAAYGASARQVALAFLLRLSSVFVIPKAANTDHVADNAGAANLHLNEAELASIDAAFPRGKPRRGLPMI